jgi:type IV pilus assembly protein PilX
MLTTRRARTGGIAPTGRQGGAVLFIVTIVLVLITLAGIALMRSIDTTSLIAGNLAFRQSATHSGDTGIEDAIAWLAGVKVNSPTTLDSDNPSNGYAAGGLTAAQSPAAGQSWDAFWAQTLAARAKTMSANSSGNTVSYVIDRMCAFAGSPLGGANCATGPMVGAAGPGASEESSRHLPLNTNAASLIYFRITARIAGPRGTVSYVQAVVAL